MFVLNFIISKWKVFLPLFLLLVLIYIVFSYINTKEEKIEQLKQQRSTEIQLELDKVDKNINAINSNINAIKNANYSNMNSNDLKKSVLDQLEKNKK